jgi:acetyl-CoA carboxylase biotin carboxyl carrier protein
MKRAKTHSEVKEMDLSLVKKILRLMEEENLREFEWEGEGVRIRLKKGGADFPPPPSAAPSPPVPSSAVPAPPAAVPETAAIVSPMVGTFYRSASASASPLVEAGTRVAKETVVCIIEAMKVMNEVTADVAGEIVEVLIKDGQAVEFGQPLFRVKI